LISCQCAFESPSERKLNHGSGGRKSQQNAVRLKADERWERLAEQQGVAYTKIVAEAMNLELDMDNPADREKLRRAVLDLVAGRKMPKQKGRG
jgi:hypothetical protein